MKRILYRLYCATEHFKRYLVARFTPLGRIMLLAVCLSLVFGLNTERTVIYQIFAFCFCALCFSFLTTLRFSPRFRVRRILPMSCIAGSTLRYRLVLENPEGRRTDGLCYQEEVIEPLPAFEAFLHEREEGEEKRNAFDRRMGYYRWLWLIATARRLTAELVPLSGYVSGVGQREAVSDAELQPVARGVARLSGYRLVKVDPLGLCKASFFCAAPARILIYPKLCKVPELHFAPGGAERSGGEATAADRGSSPEFFTTREYRYGDPVRHIDWKGTARSKQVMVRQFPDEDAAGYAIVVDTFTATSHCSALEGAVSIAASFIVTRHTGDLPELLFYPPPERRGSENDTERKRAALLEALASLPACTDMGPECLKPLLDERLAEITGILFVLIAFDDSRKALIEHLLQAGVPVRVVQIVSAGADLSDLLLDCGVIVRRVTLSSLAERGLQL